MIACLSIPYFVAAVERRAGNGQSEQPLAVGGQPWEARPVYAFSQEAASRGVRPGMSLRMVQLLSPNAQFLPAAAPHYAQVSAEVVDVLADFSPDIEPQELWHSFPESAWGVTAHGHYLPARYCLDLELPQAEAVALVQEMGRQVRQETRFAPSIGLSPDLFTAQIAATVCRSNHLLPVAAESAAEFLSSRPLGFLPLGKEQARRLHLMGVRTLGQLAELPLTALREQFGNDIERLHRMAQGRAGESLRPEPATRREEVERRFDEALNNVYALGAVLGQMADALARRLEAANLEGRSLYLTLETEDGQSQRQSVTMRRPTARAEQWVVVLEELAAKVALPCGVVGVTVAVGDLIPATSRQLELFSEGGDVSALHRAVHNLMAKYRTCGFYLPALTEGAHPLLERRFRFETVGHDPALA